MSVLLEVCAFLGGTDIACTAVPMSMYITGKILDAVQAVSSVLGRKVILDVLWEVTE